MDGFIHFLTEVRDFLNPKLLIDYMLKTIRDEPTRLLLLGNYLEGIKGTVFRQVQFAEFEMRLHEMAQMGQPIVGEAVGNGVIDLVEAAADGFGG